MSVWPLVMEEMTMQSSKTDLGDEISPLNNWRDEPEAQGMKI